ncbi:SDR family NAD(P)-dependent oxidoreductase [Dongia deserti]|uniref:SDR family NAD(P)-dependent oxidoreductase n=1 Tax=Dongia deserti TaxID=2268030 RepID=UPI000E652AF0|nr:SDR family NAD(P)-dependent oxidoreductase [Dongia deserti]
MANSEPAHILITGASSGIGAALALAYARPGAHLSLGGRNQERLADVAAQVAARGATSSTAAVDVCDRNAVADWMISAEDHAPLDLVIANAGISGGTHGGPESPDQTRAIFAVNLDGVLNVALPIIPRMIARRSGQIAIISSLAGYRGLPGAPAYSGSKAAVKAWGEALRGDLAPHGVRVNVVMPGFIKTPMTDVNGFTMPFLMSAEKAAEVIQRGLAADRARIAFPFPTAFLAWLMSALSPVIADPILRRLPKKD